MYRALFISVLLLWSGAASAQNYQCRTSAPGASSPNCASEAFVTKHFPSSSTAGHIATFADGSGNVLQDGGAPASGNVSGPGSSISGDFACWNGTSGKTLSDCGGAVNVKTTSYTIAATDCNGIVVETGAFQTITLPASLSGFPASCTIRIVNGNTARAQKLAGFPSGYTWTESGNAFLFPSLTTTVAISSGAWIVVQFPMRWPIVNPTIFVSTSGLDTNDGLSSGSPLQHISTCITLIHVVVDALGTTPTCQLADGTYIEAVVNAGQAGNQSDQIAINGNNATPTNVLWKGTAGNPALLARDFATNTITNLELACNGAPTIIVSQNSTVDSSSGVEFGDCTGEQDVQAQQGGHINFIASPTINGNAASFADAVGSGAFISMTIQVNCGGGSWNFSTAFVVADKQGQIDATGATFLNCSSVTGSRYILGSLANIITNGGGANFFPGTSAGTDTLQNGIYQ